MGSSEKDQSLFSQSTKQTGGLFGKPASDKPEQSLGFLQKKASSNNLFGPPKSTEATGLCSPVASKPVEPPKPAASAVNPLLKSNV